MKTLIIAILTLAVMAALPCNAADYYASSTRSGRSDSNSGTNPDAPWATFDKVKSAWGGLNAGDTVHLERGSVWNLSFSGDWYISRGGSSSGGALTLRGDDYGTGAKPILRRTGGSGSCAFINIQASYFTIRDIELDGGHSGYSKNTSGIAVAPDSGGVGNLNILNMYIHNLGGSSSDYICGIWLHPPSGGNVTGALIAGNTVSDYAAHGLNHYGYGTLHNIIWRDNIVINSYTGGRFPSANSALQIGSGSSGCVFEHNWLQDTTTSEGGIFGFGKNNSDTGSSAIRFNVVANSPVHGILFTMDQSGYKLNYDIYGNILLNNGRSGIAIYPYNTYASGSTFNIYNNTFYNNCTGGGSSTRGDIEIGSECASTAIVLANNLVNHRSYGTTVGLTVASGFNGTFTHRNNLYWHESGTGNSIISHSQSYTVASALNYESTAQNKSPLFKNTAQVPTAVSYASGATPDGLAVQSTSPAIGTGANLGSAYAMDINRAARTGAWTIGAYQTGGVAPPADTTLPTVSLTAPSAGAFVSGSAATVSASASDNIGVDGVQFRLNGAGLGTEDTASPYSIVWNTTGATNGLHSLTAVARDAAGNMKTSAVISVTVSNAPLPADAIISTTAWQNRSFSSQSGRFTTEFDVVPAVANMDGIIGLSSGGAADYDNLAVIVRFNDSGQIDVRNGDAYAAGTMVSYTAAANYHFRITVDVPLHVYSVYVRTGSSPETLIANNYAFRTSQNAVTSVDTLAVTAITGSHMVSGFSVSTTVPPADTTLPTVSLTAPSGGTVVSGSAATVSASASDNVGVAGVQFRLNGTSLGTEDTASPYSIVWNTTGATNGLHSLTAVARDAAGNMKTSAVISVTVSNAAPAAGGTNYYVSSIRAGRSDSNPGTSPDAPWATFDKVKSAWGGLKAGDTVHLERGSVWDLSLSGDWYVSNGGSASGGMLTLRGDDYGTGAKPILRRTGGSGSCAFFDIQRSYVTVRDIELDGGHSNYGKNTAGIIIASDDTDLSHISIQNMYVHNLGGGSSDYICGIWVSSWGADTVSDCLIEGNEVSDYSAHGLNHYSPGPLVNITWRNNIVRNAYTGGRFPSANSALQICSGNSGCLFEHNYLEDRTTTEGTVLGFGKYNDDAGVNTIRFNVIAGSSRYGILFTVDQSDKKLLYDIYGNIFYNSSLSGIALHPYNSYVAGTRFNIYNNTFYNNCTGGGDETRGDMELDAQCSNTVVDFANNLIYHRSYGSTVGLAVDYGFNGTFAHRNNLYWHEGGTGQRVITHNQTYTVANALTYETTAKNTDPRLVNVAQVPTAVSFSAGTTPNGLAVQPASPAIGAGANLGSTYALDINRTARTGAWTIGAYQAGDAIPLIDTTPPAVSLTAPSGGTVVSGSVVTVSADASDNVGVAGVQFRLNGASLGTEDTASPYSIVWNTTAATNGLHSLTAVARDAAGNMKTSAAVSVTVSNILLPPDAIVSTTAWQNRRFSPQSGRFSAEFDAVPASTNIDGIIGFSSGDAADFDDLAVIVRFNSSGRIDVRNGDTYTAGIPFSYTAAATYHFRIIVDVPLHVYSVYVRTGSSPETLIADNYAFRTSQNAAASLDTLAVTAVIGSYWAAGFTAEPLVVSPPVIIPVPPSGLRVVPNQ